MLNIAKRSNEYNEGKSDYQFTNMKVIGERFQGKWGKEGVEKYKEVELRRKPKNGVVLATPCLSSYLS